MKKLMMLTLSIMLCLTAVACTTTPTPTVGGTTEDRTATDFAQIIKDARDQETNDNMDIVGATKGETPSFKHNPYEVADADAQGPISMTMETLGLKAEMLDNFAYSTSMMNVRAYAIGIFLPAEGKAEEVQTALQGYIDRQQSAFEQYLQDQYEIAKSAVLKTLPTGEIILVMSEGAQDIATAFETALK